MSETPGIRKPWGPGIRAGAVGGGILTRAERQEWVELIERRIASYLFGFQGSFQNYVGLLWGGEDG